jgi:hypothetical protein
VILPDYLGSLATIIIKGQVSHKRNVTPLDHFHRNIYKVVCLHLRLYYGVDVTMVANDVNKFEQIFPIYRRWKYKDIA